MLIHPNILYISYTFIIIYIIYIYSINFKNFFKNFFKNYQLKWLVFYNTLALLLGSYWAEQELSWGGWWGWDFVEFIALSIYVFLLYIYHKKNKKTPQKYKNILIQTTCILLVSLFFIRFNLINSIHNFIDSDLQNQFDCYVLISINVLCIFLIFNRNIINNNITHTIVFFNIFLYIIYIYYLLILYTYINMYLYKSVFLLLLCIYVIYCSIQQKKRWCILVLMFLIQFLCVLDLYLYMFCIHLLCFFRKDISYKYIHVSCILFLFFVNHQISTFSPECLEMGLFKFLNLKVSFLHELEFQSNKNFLSKNQTLVEDNKNYFYKVIFEKIIFFNNFLELYNYNSQKLSNINANVMFICACCISFFLFKKLFFSFKNNLCL